MNFSEIMNKEYSGAEGWLIIIVAIVAGNLIGTIISTKLWESK